MTLANLGSFAVIISLLYWWFLMWHSFNLTKKMLVILNTIGTVFITFATWQLTYGVLLIPIVIIYGISTFAIFKLPVRNKN